MFAIGYSYLSTFFSCQDTLKVFGPLALVRGHTATQQHLANLRNAALFAHGYRFQLFLEFWIDPEPEECTLAHKANIAD